MINTISFDVDECILHSMLPTQDVNQEHHVIGIEDTGEIFLTVVHPKAQELIDYARLLVGYENVFLVSAGINSYIRELNSVINFGFIEGTMFGRESWAKAYPVGYGYAYATSSKWNRKNVLIDNMEYDSDNSTLKRSFLGINDPANYLQVRDYYGIQKADDDFAEKVIDFLNERHTLG